MGNDKFIDVITKIAVTLFALWLLWWLVLEPIFSWSVGGEFKLYIRLVLLLLAVMAFAQLRMYNAIVNNTRFLIKNREAIEKLLKALPSIERSIKVVSASNSKLKDAVDKLKDAIEQLRKK